MSDTTSAHSAECAARVLFAKVAAECIFASAKLLELDFARLIYSSEERRNALDLAVSDLLSCADKLYIARKPFRIPSPYSSLRLARTFAAPIDYARAIAGATFPIRCALSETITKIPDSSSSSSTTTTTISNTNNSDSSLHQQIRDVERDSFRFNQGGIISGSVVKYDGVKAALAAAIREAKIAASNATKSVPLIPNAISSSTTSSSIETPSLIDDEAIAATVLRLANRTVSGGEAFDAAAKLFLRTRPIGNEVLGDEVRPGRGASLVLRFDSSVSPGPITIDVEAGAFYVNEESTSGIVSSDTADTAVKYLRRLGEDGGVDVVTSVEECSQLQKALSESLNWSVGVKATITSTTFYQLLLDVGAEDDDEEEEGDNDHDIDEDDDEGGQEDEEWSSSEASLGLGITPSKLPRAKEKLQRRGLHVVGKVRATYLLKLGMNVNTPLSSLEGAEQGDDVVISSTLSHPVVADGSHVSIDCVCALDVS
jgi:hypothetical protein